MYGRICCYIRASSSLAPKPLSLMDWCKIALNGSKHGKTEVTQLYTYYPFRLIQQSPWKSYVCMVGLRNSVIFVNAGRFMKKKWLHEINTSTWVCAKSRFWKTSFRRVQIQNTMIRRCINRKKTKTSNGGILWRAVVDGERDARRSALKESTHAFTTAEVVEKWERVKGKENRWISWWTRCRWRRQWRPGWPGGGILRAIQSQVIRS